MEKKLREMIDGFAAEFVEEQKKMHPDDVAIYKAGKVEGQEHAPAFCREHADWFVQLIAVYGDDDARILLESIRDRFWSQKHS